MMSMPPGRKQIDDPVPAHEVDLRESLVIGRDEQQSAEHEFSTADALNR